MPTMPNNNGYSVGRRNCVSTLLAFIGFPRIHGAMFSNVAVVHKFFLLAAVLSLFANLLKITFVYSPFSFLSALFIPLGARSLSLFFFFFLFPLSRYKICSNANGRRNTKDKIFALETGEFNLLLRSRRRKNNRLWCAFVRIISAIRTFFQNKDYSSIFIVERIKTLGERERKGEKKIVRGCVWSNCEVPIHKSDKVRKCSSYKSTHSKRACDTFS